MLHSIQLLVENHIVQGPDRRLGELRLVHKVVGDVPHENVRIKVGVKLCLICARCRLEASIRTQLILLTLQDLDMQVLVVRAHQRPLKLYVLAAEANEVLEVPLESSRLALILREVNSFLAWSPLLGKLGEDDRIPRALVHLDHAHVYLSDSQVRFLVFKRSDLQETESDFEVVLCCVEGVREVFVHVAQDGVLDEAGLLIEDHVVELEDAVGANDENYEEGERGSDLGLVGRLSLEVHVDWLAE